MRKRKQREGDGGRYSRSMEEEGRGKERRERGEENQVVTCKQNRGIEEMLIKGDKEEIVREEIMVCYVG